VWGDVELTWWSDIDPGAIAVSERHHPNAPNIGDLSTVDWMTMPEVDILTAGYPCQPFSNAGKRLGTEDPRHIWPHIARGIGVLRPAVVILENVAGHVRRGLDVVIGDPEAEVGRQRRGAAPGGVRDPNAGDDVE
jgi:DNA (cytosine-5)-methyltransferase 1